MDIDPLNENEELGNKQEKEKFSKEHSMCRTLASNDFNVTYLESVQGSYDVSLNGIPAELKKVDSSKQIYRHARKAFEVSCCLFAYLHSFG